MEEILEKIDRSRIPKHVAIIMDGNGRWAKNLLLPRTAGHKKGVDAVEEVLEAASILGVEALTLYAFSTENWKRPTEEVSYIFKLPKLFYTRLIDKLMLWNIKIKWIGEITKLPNTMQKLIADFESKTEKNTGLLLYLAFNYGARSEITATVKKISQAVLDGELAISEIDEAFFGTQLYTGENVNVDFLIRTSGELRMSNFLLWQIAYSELYFTDKLWPDFSKNDFYHAIFDYQQRNIRKGGL
ncbi:undecaprenyl pyrophosphate synthase [Erysipelotrichaceae bacterium]|nr:undecaprenyl pyrophosphate synthase [Erysipelotrichaceae bacterium]